MRIIIAAIVALMLTAGAAQAQQKALVYCSPTGADAGWVPAGECGTPGTGIQQPTGGVGQSGWLSAIKDATTKTLAAIQGGVVILSGTVTAIQGAAGTVPWPTVPSAQSASPTNVSGSIGQGGTAQQLFAACAANVVRHVIIQNLSLDPLGFSKVSVSPVVGNQGTYLLQAATSATAGNGGSYSTPPGINDCNAFYIVGATTGDRFTAETQ